MIQMLTLADALFIILTTELKRFYFHHLRTRTLIIQDEDDLNKGTRKERNKRIPNESKGRFQPSMPTKCETLNNFFYPKNSRLIRKYFFFQMNIKM